MNIDNVKDEMKNIKEDKSHWFYIGPFDDNTIEQLFLETLKNIEYKFNSEDEYNNLNEAIRLKYNNDDYYIEKSSDEIKKLINEIEIVDSGNTCNNSSMLVFKWVTFKHKEKDEIITAISMHEYGDYRACGYSNFCFVDGDIYNVFEEIPYISFGSTKINDYDSEVYISQNPIIETGDINWDYEGYSGSGYAFHITKSIPAKVRALASFVLENFPNDLRRHRFDYKLKEIGPFIFIILDDKIQHVFIDGTQFSEYDENNPYDDKFLYKMSKLDDNICRYLKDVEFNIKDLEKDFEMLKFDEDAFIAYSEIGDNFVEILEVNLNDYTYKIFQTTLSSDDLSDEYKNIIEQKHFEKVTNILPNMY